MGKPNLVANVHFLLEYFPADTLQHLGALKIMKLSKIIRGKTKRMKMEWERNNITKLHDEISLHYQS